MLSKETDINLINLKKIQFLAQYEEKGVPLEAKIHKTVRHGKLFIII